MDAERKLVGRVGWVRAGHTFWTELTDGGPFVSLDGPVQFESGVYGQRFVTARRVSDGGIVSIDAANPAWTLAAEKGAV